jgi:bacillithiol synthase
MQAQRLNHWSSLPDLVRRYLLLEFPHLTSHLPTIDAMVNAAEHRHFSKDKRQRLVDSWRLQYEPNSPRQDLIDRLLSQNTCTITTGHQLTLATGPAYTIYKITSTVALAEKWNKQGHQQYLIPVFWLASEDHDFDEINHVYTKETTLQWNREAGGPVGRMSIHGASEILEPWIQLLTQRNHPTDAEIIKTAWQTTTLSQAVRILVDAFFVDHEVLILDADQRELKSMFTPIMEDEIMHSAAYDAMASSIQWLKNNGFPLQVNGREINIFYQSDDFRKRIVKRDDGFATVNGPEIWTDESLRNELQNKPEYFSPNVIMRPLYQEFILPNVAYIGGPGELSYWLQLKPVFERFQVPMPLVLLRDSALVLSKGATKKWSKWGGSPDMIFMGSDALKRHLVQAKAPDLTNDFLVLADAFKNIQNKMATLEPALAVAADMERKKTMDGLLSLEKKMYKTVKQKDEVLLQQIDTFYDEINPTGVPQERYLNFFELQSYFPSRLLPHLLDGMDPLNPKLLVLNEADPNSSEEG